MRQPFDGCEEGFVRDVCHGACCVPGPKGGALERITIAMIGAGTHYRSGADIVMSRECLCPHFTADYHCGMHGSPDKPWDCVVAPFTLSSNNLLGVYNRYRLLPCFKAGRALPAYEAFRTSLVTLFGEAEADRVSFLAATGTGIFEAQITEEVYRTVALVKEIEGIGRRVTS